MRFDDTGLFWSDWKPPKVVKQKVVKTPPDPVWLRSDYLPYLDEALQFDPPQFTDSDLIQAALMKERLVWDIESYPNYWCCCFLSIDSGRCIFFESTDDEPWFNKSKLDWVLRNFLLIDFNGEKYDRHIAAIALKPGTDCRDMWEATSRIIKWGEPGWMVARDYRVRKLAINHIDTFELTPLAPSLKTMAGRLGSPLMMDLPFKPGTELSLDQARIVFWYCFNDLRNTWLVYHAHQENIELRQSIGPRYQLDLRSKSDAQMAEAIFKREVLKRTGQSPRSPDIRPFHRFHFHMPDWITYLTENLQWVRDQVEQTEFVIGESGYIQMPEVLADLVIPIGKAHYKMGIGGLHSREEGRSVVANSQYMLLDFDVPSYYPKLILGSGMYPPAIGPAFVPIYQNIVDERLAAKAAHQKVKAEALKIVVNGTFGKSLEPHSTLYYPELGIQTTISGQLALLMLIERVTLAGFDVVSANTDGVTIWARRDQKAALHHIVKGWEQDSGLELEPTEYDALYSRDVNNYIAVKHDGTIKTKGVFGEAGIKKNPQMEICSDAVVAYLTKGVPLHVTINQCADINKFVSVRNVRGGCAKIHSNGYTEYVGKVARWAYFEGETGEIITCNKGHLVPTTENARPMMRYGDEFPVGLDYEYYLSCATAHMAALGLAD